MDLILCCIALVITTYVNVVLTKDWTKVDLPNLKKEIEKDGKNVLVSLAYLRIFATLILVSVIIVSFVTGFTFTGSATVMLLLAVWRFFDSVAISVNAVVS